MESENEINNTLDRIARQQPIVKFGSDEYFCDARNGEFRRRGEQFNAIRFDSLIDLFDDSSLLYYDQKKHDAVQVQAVTTNLPKHVVLIRLPPIPLLDPVGFAIWAKVQRDTFITNSETFFTITDKVIKERYKIKNTITRVTPKFGYVDKMLKKNKFNNKKK